MSARVRPNPIPPMLAAALKEWIERQENPALAVPALRVHAMDIASAPFRRREAGR